MRHFLFVSIWLACLSMATLAQATEASSEDIAAKTMSGDETILHPNGYWEYLDKQKAAQAKIQVEKIAREEDCPPGTRPSFLAWGVVLLMMTQC